MKRIILKLFIGLFIFMEFLDSIKNKIRALKAINYFRNVNVQNITDIYHKILLKSNRTNDEELNDCRKFMNEVANHSSFTHNKIFYRSENPKISIVIPMYNAEGYIENGIYAIEKQDFKDIEIIIIDDKSKDNSIRIVKQFMKKDLRINLYKNKYTKGTLYSKSIGVTYSKGKYVLVSDQDDLYSQEDAFTTMYYEMEKNNLDILGFSTISVPNIIFRYSPFIRNFRNTQIYHQPYVSYRMFYFKSNNTLVRMGNVIWNYIYKRNIFIKSINQIDDKTMNTRMNCHEDFLLFFLLTRNAKSIKNIKRVFYAHINWVNSTKKSVLFSKKEKNIVNRNYKCLSHINYIEFLLNKTKDTVKDKRIASFELNNYYLKNKCNNNTFIRKRAKNVCKLFLENHFIEQDVKQQILHFLNTTK